MTQVPVIYLATKFQAEVNSVEKKSVAKVVFPYIALEKHFIKDSFDFCRKEIWIKRWRAP